MPVIVPTIFGPFVENYPPHRLRTDLGSGGLIYSLIKDTTKDGEFSPNLPPFTHAADVRDVAKAVC